MAKRLKVRLHYIDQEPPGSGNFVDEYEDDPNKYDTLAEAQARRKDLEEDNAEVETFVGTSIVPTD